MYRLLVSLVALCLSVSAQAEQPTHTWKFDLKTPGAYDVHVQHKFEQADTPLDVVATYTFQTKEKIDKRDVPISFGGGKGHRVAVLTVDVPSPQKVSVVVTGIPQPLLKKTRVYVVEANSVSPENLFDPKNSIELKSAKRIRDILKQPDHAIDFASAKLTIDKMIDPSINIEANLKKIEAMATEIKAMAGVGASSNTRMLALKRYLYEPGVWNNFRPYQYDLDDPLGKKISNKLLSNYIASKNGNCVTMPFLFIVLGQRLGIEVTASTAPEHILVKYRDDATGVWYSLEATSGANPARDVWYRSQMPMTDQAIANGVYLRPLTKKETVAMMVTTLAEHFFHQQEFEKAITISDLVLEYDSKDVESMIRKGSSYYRLLDKHYFSKYRSPNAIPINRRGHFEYLSRNNHLWFAKAEALGWREPSKEDEEKYLQSVKNAKRKH